ncbi:hypothetical protein B9Z55_016163 [Caenorhabditis nigoni]|uniref:Uncharacterized protein n=1 Tax=Caenorhabditis nigoni TaxID=1611254 RepID=A0A2G5UEB6_9PELO|nr:hypothetical protein B9Z55_016163 [Caenorhabditis nigoni]
MRIFLTKQFCSIFSYFYVNLHDFLHKIKQFLISPYTIYALWIIFKFPRKSALWKHLDPAPSSVLSCLRPEEVPHFREIIKKYNSGEANVKIFAQKLVELLGPTRKKRLSYLKHVLRADDIRQFDAAIL